MKETISIIIPVCNMERYLKRCLLSVQRQTYPHLEITIVDYGSTDNSLKIIDSFAQTDSRIKQVSTKCYGPFRARLEGVSKATGQWIGFIDADDEIEPAMYETLINNALRHKKEISHCGLQRIFPDGRVQYIGNTGELVTQDRNRAIVELIEERGSIASLCNKLFKADLFQRISHSPYLNEKVKYGEDLLLNYLIFSAADGAVYEGVCPYHYVVHRGSLLMRRLNSDRVRDPIHVRDLIRKDISEELFPAAQKVYIKQCLLTYNTLIAGTGRDVVDPEEIRRRISLEKKTFHLLGDRIELLADLLLASPDTYLKILQDSKMAKQY